MTQYQVKVLIHNVPPHGNGELCFRVLNPAKDLNTKDEHIDGPKDNITHMGRAYQACFSDDEAKFILQYPNGNRYFKKKIEGKIVEVDFYKDGKDI